MCVMYSIFMVITHRSVSVLPDLVIIKINYLFILALPILMYYLSPTCKQIPLNYIHDDTMTLCC